MGILDVVQKQKLYEYLEEMIDEYESVARLEFS